jgi:chromosome segregation ATPase
MLGLNLLAHNRFDVSDLEQDGNRAQADDNLASSGISPSFFIEFASGLSGLFDQLEQVEALKEKFAYSLSRFVGIGNELEGTRRQNQQILEVLDAERNEKVILLDKISQLENEIVQGVEAKSAVIVRIERLASRMELLESDVERERVGQRSLMEQLARQTEELDHANSELSLLQNELSFTRSALELSEIQATSRDIEFASLSSALHHAQTHEQLFKDLLDESTEQNARLSRQLREIEPSNSSHKIQIMQLSAALEDERLAKERISSERMDGLELLRDELKSGNARLEAALARADANERMLNDSRVNYREKLEELRLSDRRAVDLGIQLTNIQRRAEAAESENAGIVSRFSRLEAERGQFTTQLDNMNRALTEKDAAIALANDRTTFIMARLEECQRAAKVEREKFEADLAAITHLFHGGHQDQTLLDGALEQLHHHNQLPRVEAEVTKLIGLTSPIKLPEIKTFATVDEDDVEGNREPISAVIGE